MGIIFTCHLKGLLNHCKKAFSTLVSYCISPAAFKFSVQTIATLLFISIICTNKVTAQTRANVTISNTIANGGFGTTNGSWALAGGNVIIINTSSTGTQNGDIIVDILVANSFTATGGKNLTFTAAGNITVNSKINLSGFNAAVGAGSGGNGAAILFTAASGNVNIYNAIINTGGKGGNTTSGNAGAGGQGGSITINCSGNVNVGSNTALSDSLVTRGGNGGDCTVINAGGGGTGTKGGVIAITSGNGIVTIQGNSGFSTVGGNGGGANSTSGNSGAGGNGGDMSISAKNGISIGASSSDNDSLLTRGGIGGFNLNKGGGAGGTGGKITLASSAGTIVITGNGGVAADGANGGQGGGGSATGDGGGGGVILIGAITGTGQVNIASSISSNGGNGGSHLGTSSPGAGGTGGAISILSASTVITDSINSNGGIAGTIPVSGNSNKNNGGKGGIITVTSGTGTTVTIGGAVSSSGGAGSVGYTASGGTGGDANASSPAIIITGPAGITTNGTLAAQGGSGGASSGGGGGAGGAGKGITLSSSGNVFINGMLNSLGGNAGNGTSSVSSAGGNGGNISVTGTTGITIGSSSADNDSVLTRGGNGGNNPTSSGGGAGGNAGTIALTSNGPITANSVGGFSAAGGAGGIGASSAAGAGGNGNTITIGSATAGAITLNGALNSSGGAGGAANISSASGAGGTAAAISIISGNTIITDSLIANGGNAGNATNSAGNSGGAASITVTSGSSSSVTINGAASASGGFNTSTTSGTASNGGAASTINISAGSGGISVTSSLSSKGGSGGSSTSGTGGASANGNTITLSTTGSISVTGAISTTGGAAGSLSSSTKNGGTGGNIAIGTASTTSITTGSIISSGGNGSGHATANPGTGGAAGTVTLLAKGNINTADISSNGANAGNTTGASSQAVTGGSGGAINITSSTTGAVTVTGVISSSGGIGTTASSTTSTTNTGGAGGTAGNNGSNIAIKISAIAGISVTSLTAEGGAGGTNFASSGGGHGGAGGAGMGISLLSPGPIAVNGTISSKGGASGLAKTLGTGGRGGDGGAINIGTAGSTTSILTGAIVSSGSNGGDGIGQPGQGGNAGIVTVLATGTIATASITSDGGNAGNTVSGSQNNNGGNGAAVNITTTGAAATVTVTGAVSSSGGSGSSTSSAAATTNTTGAGGAAGSASSVAINIVAPGGVNITSSVTAKGGNGGSNASTTTGNGHGGSGSTGFNIVITAVNGSAIIGGAINSNGGNGGNATSGKTNGSGAAAGTIAITGGTGITIPQSISAIGGVAGTGGTGGSSSNNSNITISDGGTVVTAGSTSNNAGVSGVMTGLNFTSSGTGILKLSAANQYTGTTTISDTLQIAIAGALPVVATNNITLNGGTISTAGGIGGTGVSNGTLLGKLTVTGSGSAITLGSGSHSLQFSNTTTGVYGTAPLVINNWLNVPGSSGIAGRVFIGPINDLTSTQLGTITFKGYCGVAKYVPSGSGELTPTPTPAINLTSINQAPSPACLNSTPTITISGVTAGGTVNYKIGSGYYSSVLTFSGGGTATFTTPALTQAMGTALVIDSVNYGTCWITVTGSTALSLSVASTAVTSTIQSSGTACANTATSIQLSGLVPGVYYTATYTINGGPVQTTAAVLANGSGNIIFSTVSIAPAMSGKTLQILTLYDGSCTTNVTGSTSTTLSVFQPAALNSVGQTPSPACIKSTATITLGGLRTGTAYTVIYTINGGSNQTTTTSTADILGNANFTTIPLTASMNNTPLQIVSLDSLPGTCAATTYITGAANTYCTLSVYQTVTWLGVDNDWNNVNNWCGGIPDSTTDVIIPTVASAKYPKLSSALAAGIGKGAVKNITISSSSASVTLDSTGILSIAGSITNAGTLDASAGTIRMCGTVNQTIDGGAFVRRTINNLIICNNSTAPSVQLANTTGDTLNIMNAVSFGVINNANFKTNNNLALKSTVNNTASIADISNGGSSTGNTVTDSVIIERYFPAHRSWRLVTAPVNAAGAPTISKAWQEGLINTSRLSPVYNSNYGTIITKNTTAVNGYDAGSTSNPSIYYYNSGAWSAPGATNTGHITDRPGYLLFVRGSRNYIVANQYNPATVTTLRVKGLINQDSVNIGGTGTTVIGNPFASTINYTGIYERAHNLAATYYVWDPFTTGSNSTGSFITMHDNGDGTYDAVPDPTDPSPLNDSYRHPIDKEGNIQSGQAFIVYFTNGDPAAAPPTGYGIGNSKIKETDKRTQTNNYYFRPAVPLSSTEKFRTNLYAQNSDGTISLEDGLLNLYNDKYSNAVNYLEDAPKVGNISETIGLLREGRNLAIDARKIIGTTDTIFYSLFGMQQKTYILQMEANGLNHTGLTGILVDSFLNTRTPLNLNGTTDITFTVTANAASSALHRFTVLFVPAEGGTLPVSFTSIKATQQSAKQIAVQWSVQNQVNIKTYQIQKSTDGSNFITVGIVAATGTGLSSEIYSWQDNDAVAGNNYYRIVSVETEGGLSYSNVANVKLQTVNMSVSVYPNPIKNNLIGLQFTDAPEGVYNLRLLDNIGQELFTKSITHPGGTGRIPVQISGSLAGGAYTLEIINRDNTKQSVLLLIE